jgi:hypothetical protein
MAKKGPKPRHNVPKAESNASAQVARVGRPKADGENVSGYFRAVFAARPDLLDAGSNQELLGQWLKDHPGQREVPARVKNVLSNLKSVLRKQRRKQRAGKGTAERPAPRTSAAQGSAVARLEALEERIDGCMSLAGAIDREGLEAVYQLLRRARNEVVWKIGQ